MDKIPIGYNAICAQLRLNTLPHYRKSYVVKKGRGKVLVDNNHEIHIYPKSFALQNEKDLLANLEFALKYDGVNLEIIKAFFEKIEKKRIVEYIQQKPTGIYSRKIWYLYEFLMRDQLALKDCRGIKYVNLLDPKIYFTRQGIKSPRHAINDNFLGSYQFCPLLRRTTRLEKYVALHLDKKAKVLLKKYDPHIVSRACNYLYTKETISSYQIEREQPDKNRIVRFINLLQEAPKIKVLSKEKLIELQNIIVDPRFKNFDYRHNQNYVGETVNPYVQKIHYISPKPEDVPALMEGLLETLDSMLVAQIHPVIIAAAISFGFVFIHPFEDGNGRIHRFLIHYVLSKTQFTPTDTIFPISSIMLQNMRDYDKALESFSKPLLSLLTDYHLSEDGCLSVKQKSQSFYQYLDFTIIAEYLFTCIEEAIYTYIEREIEFLAHYDKAKRAIQEIVDMPDNLIDLLIKCVLQNKGQLSKKKKNRYFSLLTEEEIRQLVTIICEVMHKELVTPIKN